MAVTPDASSTATGGSATTASWSHTCTGTDCCLYVAVGLDGSGTPAATATYNGVSMTKLSELAGQQGLALFRLVNPASGSNTVQINWSGSFVWATVGISFTGVHQTTPDAGTASIFEVATGTSVTHDVSSATGAMVLDALSLNAGTAAGTTPGSGQTAVESAAAAAATICAMSYEAGAATVTMSWSWSTGSNRNTHSLISIAAAEAGAAFVAKPLPPIQQAVARASSW